MPHVSRQGISEADGATRTQQLDGKMRRLWMPERRKQLAIESFNLGQDCRDSGHAALAETNFRRTLALFQTKRPTRSKGSLQAFALVAASHNYLGLLRLEAGDAAEASASFDRAIGIRRELQRLFPDNRENQVYLGGALCNRAHAVADSDPTTAQDFYQQSLAVLRQPNRTCECSYWDEQRGSWWCEQLEALGNAAGLEWVSLAPQFIDHAMEGLRSVEPPGCEGP